MSPAIGKDFSLGSLLKFAFPTIVMMIFMSLYSIVDGFFVSRFIGTDALSATNIVWPALNIMMGIAIMLATGGSAIVARTMGEGKSRSAKERFTLIVVSGFTVGVVISAICIPFLREICLALGSSDALLGYCEQYLLIQLIFAPALMLQILFQGFFVATGKPGIGLFLTVLAGLTNGILDYIFIVPMQLGVMGAALATAAGYLVPSIVGLIFFSTSKKGLHFVKPRLEWRTLLLAAGNGSSEMVTNLSAGIVTFLFNILMMQQVGSDGVAAITIVLYAQALLLALFMGFSMGVAPVISYNHGSENEKRLKKVFKISMGFILSVSVIVYATAIILCDGLVKIFSPEGTLVYDLATRGFWLFSLSFLFTGVNIFASGLFTAFSNGKVSAIISFMRTFVFILLGLLILPSFLEIDGIWLAVPFAELLTFALSSLFLKKMGKVYHYV